LGEINKAILDINALAKLIPDNTKAYFQLTELHYKLGDADLALNDVRECLKLDPDQKKCSTFYKSLRKLTKFLDNMKKAHDEQRYDECIAASQQVFNHDKDSAVFRHRAQSMQCSCYSKAKKTKEAIEICTLLIKNNPNDAESYYNRAQAYIIDELLELAQADCHRANDLEQSQRTAECNEKINKLIKQSEKRDYYKILGVKRTADKKAILKAYRKLANIWHPDKFQDAEKEAAQKKFIDIAAAKEVLTDPEKRAKFDNGEDPLDAEEQANQNRGFNPFGQGFNPFGHQQQQQQHQGGGFNFKFKFN
jgi:DnaJ family protein C protein 3